MILLKINECYDYYDIPLTFSAKDECENLYICFLAEDDGNQVTYLATQVTKGKMLELLSNKINLNSVFRNPEFTKIYKIILTPEANTLVTMDFSGSVENYLFSDDYYIGEEILDSRSSVVIENKAEIISSSRSSLQISTDKYMPFCFYGDSFINDVKTPQIKMDIVYSNDGQSFSVKSFPVGGYKYIKYKKNKPNSTGDTICLAA